MRGHERVFTRVWSRDTNFYCDPSVRNDVHGTRAATWTDNRPSRRDLCLRRLSAGENRPIFVKKWRDSSIPDCRRVHGFRARFQVLLGPTFERDWEVLHVP